LDDVIEIYSCYELSKKENNFYIRWNEKSIEVDYKLFNELDKITIDDEEDEEKPIETNKVLWRIDKEDLLNKISRNCL